MSSWGVKSYDILDRDTQGTKKSTIIVICTFSASTSSNRFPPPLKRPPFFPNGVPSLSNKLFSLGLDSPNRSEKRWIATDHKITLVHFYRKTALHCTLTIFSRRWLSCVHTCLTTASFTVLVLTVRISPIFFVMMMMTMVTIWLLIFAHTITMAFFGLAELFLWHFSHLRCMVVIIAPFFITSFTIIIRDMVFNLLFSDRYGPNFGS